MFKATREISRAFDAKGIKYRVIDKEKVSYVEASVRGKVAPSVDIDFFSSDDDNDVSVRVVAILRAPDNRLGQILVAINECNNRFRFVKFVLDKDRDVNLEFDMPLRTTNPGDVAVEMLIRIMKIIDDAYPVLMKAVFG